MKQFSAEILGNTLLSRDFYEIEFSWDRKAGIPLPGMFFTVRVSEDTVPLLRRPFALSAFDSKKKRASMIVQKRGRGTELFSAVQKGDPVDVIGPLGKAFPMPGRRQKPLLVAGGIGLGPLLFLASRLGGAKLVFGCRTKDFVPKPSVFAGMKPVICTDDGSRGFRGTAGDYLKSIESAVCRDTILYACGPRPMLKACHWFAQERGCECYVSVEQVMACGVGACMGCAVKAADGSYKRACTDGPVFNSKELKWD